jgi:C1A family cysteine protease
MVVGTDWHEGMLETDRHGFVHAAGFGVGGHAFVLKGANTRKRCPDGSLGAYRIANSWGTRWGDGGYAWLSIKDMRMLLANQGEACTAIELKA